MEGKNDASVDPIRVDTSLQDFVFDCQCFVHEVGLFQETRMKILKIQNEALDLVNLCGINTSEAGIKKSKENPELDTTPVKSANIAQFIKVTPKKELLPQFPCSVEKCKRSYGMLRSLRRHLRDEHKIMEAPEGMTEYVDHVTCKMCWKKIPRDKLTTHLVSVHKCQKDDPSGVLRGFISFDGKNWRPLWLPRFVENPPDISSASIPIVNGKFHYYGGIFDASCFDCQIVEEDDDINSDGMKDVVSSKDGCIQDRINQPSPVLDVELANIDDKEDGLIKENNDLRQASVLESIQEEEWLWDEAVESSSFTELAVKESVQIMNEPGPSHKRSRYEIDQDNRVDSMKHSTKTHRRDESVERQSILLAKDSLPARENEDVRGGLTDNISSSTGNAQKIDDGAFSDVESELGSDDEDMRVSRKEYKKIRFRNYYLMLPPSCFLGGKVQLFFNLFNRLKNLAML